MVPSSKRLYIVTGKGGVGKTTLSMSLVKFLESKGKKVYYNSFGTIPNLDLIQKINLPHLETHLFESAEIYIGRKLKSTTIASWIMKTPFFKSLFQMVPGLGNMILLGHILDELEKHPELTVVIDSPASGHALTMFESASNFKKIFRQGLIVKDIDRMHSLLRGENFLKTIVVSLPTELSIQEGRDFTKELQTESAGLNLQVETIINDSYFQYMKENSVDIESLPDFLKQKVINEKEVITNEYILPHINNNNQSIIINEMTQSMEKLL